MLKTFCNRGNHGLIGHFSRWKLTTESTGPDTMKKQREGNAFLSPSSQLLWTRVLLNRDATGTALPEAMNLGRNRTVDRDPDIQLGRV
jgi:hypothetical protein